ncbi:MAG: TonB-dependent receptor, partial [Bacteroidales bacterium]
MIKKSTKGVVTDIDGNFTIQVNPRDYLVISYLGMETQEIPVSAQNTYIIKLQTAANKLEDVTIVAFGKQKKESVIASVTAVNPAELKVPSSNLTTALAGRMSGVISYQRSGEPGDDNAEFFIRGVTSFGYSQSPLILLDGFEISSADLARINPDDIARFSIMKDATATALYGARGANGVILVNTKEGEEGKIKISFRHETSLSMPTRLMKLADGVTYMNLYNQATFNKNEEYHPYYSAQKIQNTIDGINPYAFPNVNWYDELFEKNTINQRYNLNLSGGGKLAKYYLSANYSRDNGILQVDKRNNFNSNIAIDKFDLRTNINLNLTKTTKVNFKLNSKFERYNGPIKSGNDIFNSVMKSNPVDFPKYFIPVGSEIYTKHILFGSSNDGGVNPYADMVKGYKDSFTTNILAQFQVEQELDFITKGLSLRASANACSYSYYGSERSYDPYFYTLKDYNEIDGNYDIFQTKEGTESLGDPKIGKNANNRLYFEVAAQYSRQFFDKHDVGGLLVYTQTEALNTISSNKNTIFATLPSRNLGVAGRFSYGYDSRYMLEVNFGYNGSERFHKSNRYGFFPSFGLGYMISNEKFWSTCTRVVPKLKLKYTFGWVGNDAIADPDDRFFFMSEIVTNSEGYIYGKEFNGSFSGYGVKRFSNPDITWEISKKHNMGFEMNLFNIFDLNLDLFKEIRENIYMERETLPASMGLTAPVSNNMGRVDSKGVDWSVDVNHFFNKNFWISGRFNFTYATNKVIEKEEVAYKYPYLYRVGHPVNQQWGLVAERLFIDDNDVFNAPRQTWGATVGDIKYKDINNDGVVNND